MLDYDLPLTESTSSASADLLHRRTGVWNVVVVASLFSILPTVGTRELFRFGIKFLAQRLIGRLQERCIIMESTQTPHL